MSHVQRTLRVVALTVVLALGLAACSDDKPDTTSAESRSKLAAAALSAGLEAHAQGDLPTAKTNYEAVLKYDPTNKYAFYNLALIDESDGNYGLAETAYRNALDSDPAYVPALFNLGILLTARNQPQEAMELYQRAVQADSTNAGAWLNLGLLQRSDGQKKAGDRSVAKALALDPNLKDPLKPAAGSGQPAAP